MLGSKGIGDSTLSTRMRLGARLGTLLGVCGMFVCCLGLTQTGPCPGGGGGTETCTAVADCDQGSGCETAACTDGACVYTDACDADHCVDDACVECLEDSDCDNADVCDGAETCGDDGACAAGTALDCDDADACTTDACDAATGCSNTDVVCGTGEECVDGNCITPCDEDADCDDGTFCNGAETCTDGACAAGADPCPDNGVFCDGTESCDAATDACQSSGDPCSGDTPVCDETAGECVAGEACTTNADCPDNGTFCDGTESCVEGFCQSSGDPCDTTAGETCNEDLNQCDEEVDPNVQSFTLSLDNLSGTAAANTFSGNLAFNAPTGTNVPTVQTGDSANGGDGSDSMTAVFNFTGATTVAPTLTSIETLTVTDFGTAATTLQGTSITGLTTLNTLNSSNTNALVVNNLAGVPDVGITNNTAGLSLAFVTAATSGSADDMTVNLSNVTAGTLTLTSATTNGLETVTVNSTGAANTLAGITQTTGTTLATLIVTGDTLLTVTAALPGSIATVNAGADTGGVSVNLTNNTGNLTVTGGTGNDTFTVGANYTSGDTVNGGAGTGDLLGLTSATAAAAAMQTNVSNIEGLTITDGLANAVTASRFGSISTVNLESNFTGAVTLTLPASGATVNVGARTASNDGTASGTIDVTGLNTNDTLTFNINDSDTSSAYIFTGVETLTLTSNNRGDGNAADGTVNTIGGALTLTPTVGTGTITLTGAANLTLTGAMTAGILNGSAFTGNLVMSAATAVATQITTGSGNDTLFGSTSGDTVLNAGSGTNIIEGRAGIDSVGPLGTGVDTIRISSGAANGADRKLVTGFTAGSGGDVVNIDANDYLTMSGTDNFATGTSIQAHSAAGNVTVSATTEILRVTAGTLTNLTDANSLNGTNLLVAVGGTITMNADLDQILILVADGSGNTGVYVADESADAGAALAAADITLVAVLQTTTLANFVFSNFTNVN